MVNKFRPLQGILVFLVLSLLWLAACTPEAPIPSSGVLVPHLDAIVKAISSGSTQDLVNLVKFSTLPCTKAEGLGGPPKCLPDEAEGTQVEVLPVLGPEGHFIRKSDISTWTGVESAQLYAAYKTAAGTYSDEFFPAGAYAIAFRYPDETQGVVFQVTQDGIVRVDYLGIDAIDEIIQQSEVLFQQTPAG